ncbi:MAG: tetratricopeptide repeat protein [Pseudomonadota bacterium]
MSTKYKAIAWLIILLLTGSAGCGSAPVVPPPEGAALLGPPPEPAGTPDHVRLKNALTGRELPAVEVADLSERLLANGNSTLQDQETMARLELMLLKALKGQDKTYHPVLWRNLGIIHYHQKKYRQARQELQASNELNPRSARTHFYLARLFAHQGQIYEKQGKQAKSRQQFKRAAIEMEQARKIEPHNSLYRKDAKEVIEQEQGK